MAREYDDVVAEMLALREGQLKYSEEARVMREEIKTLRTELEWWRKTFGPEKFAK